MTLHLAVRLLPPVRKSCRAGFVESKKMLSQTANSVESRANIFFKQTVCHATQAAPFLFCPVVPLQERGSAGSN